MALITLNEKLSLITQYQPHNTPVPAPDGAVLTQGNNQHLIWDFSGILWAEPLIEKLTGDSEMIKTFICDSEMIKELIGDSKL